MEVLGDPYGYLVSEFAVVIVKGVIGLSDGL